jgi:hypothetical protein
MGEDGMKEPPLAGRPEDLNRDFEIMRENSRKRAPKCLEELFSFLAFFGSFGTPAVRLRPKDAGRCRL